MVEENVLGHDGGNFLVGENLVPLYEGLSEVLDDFPQLFLSEMCLLIFTGGYLEVEGVYVWLIGNLHVYLTKLH